MQSPPDKTQKLSYRIVGAEGRGEHHSPSFPSKMEGGEGRVGEGATFREPEGPGPEGYAPCVGDVGQRSHVVAHDTLQAHDLRGHEPRPSSRALVIVPNGSLAAPKTRTHTIRTLHDAAKVYPDNARGGSADQPGARQMVIGHADAGAPLEINPKDSMTRPAQLAALRWQKEADLVDALAALEVHHGGAGQVKTTGRFEQQLLHYRALFLREATATRFDHPIATCLLCAALVFTTAYWHQYLVLQHCTSAKSWLNAVLQTQHESMYCRDSAIISITSVVLYIFFSLLALGIYIVDSPWRINMFLLLPRLMSSMILIPGSRVRSDVGIRATVSDLICISLALALFNATMTWRTNWKLLLKKLLASTGSMACVVVYGANPALWPNGRIPWGSVIGAGILCIVATATFRITLSSGGLANFQPASVAPSPSRGPALLFHRAVEFLTPLGRAVDGFLRVITMRNLVQYALAWATTVGLVILLAIGLMKQGPLDVHPAWTLLVILVIGLQRKTAMDAIRFRDTVISNLVPEEVADALMRNMRTSADERRAIVHARSTIGTTKGDSGKDRMTETEHAHRVHPSPDTIASREDEGLPMHVCSSNVADGARGSIKQQLDTASSGRGRRRSVAPEESGKSFVKKNSIFAPDRSGVHKMSNREGQGTPRSTKRPWTNVPGSPVFLREYQDVTMIFSDVVSFTTMSSDAAPMAVLSMLHDYFTRLDSMVDAVPGAYKYETVGDAYVVAVNLLSPCKNHQLVALRIALSMVALASKVQKADGSGPLEIRVGVHTGPVAGGVLGVKRTLLTLCGDTLNVASRMESNSKPGYVRLSWQTAGALPQEVLRLVKGETIDVKGKGMMHTGLVHAMDPDVIRAVVSCNDTN